MLIRLYNYYELILVLSICLLVAQICQRWSKLPTVFCVMCSYLSLLVLPCSICLLPMFGIILKPTVWVFPDFPQGSSVSLPLFEFGILGIPAQLIVEVSFTILTTLVWVYGEQQLKHSPPSLTWRYQEWQHCWFHKSQSPSFWMVRRLQANEHLQKWCWYDYWLDWTIG